MSRPKLSVHSFRIWAETGGKGVVERLRSALRNKGAVIVLAVCYWLWLIIKYFEWPFGDPNLEYGGLTVLIYTLPWSVVGQFITVPAATALARVTNAGMSDAVSFLVLVGLCGGLNGYLLLHALRIPAPRRFWNVFAVTILLLAVIAQTTVDKRAQIAVEYHRPAGVPKAAVVIPHLATWYWPQSTLIRPGVAGLYWQLCEADLVHATTYCKIWSLDGDVWYDEEFIPYDGGPAPPAADLKPVEHHSGPNHVALANGRFLVPWSRRAELTRILDWKTGKMKTP